MSEITAQRDYPGYGETANCLLCGKTSAVREIEQLQGLVRIKMECGHLGKWVTVYANNQNIIWAQIIDVNKLQTLNIYSKAGNEWQ